MKDLKQEIGGLKLKQQDDLVILDGILEEVKAENYPLELFEPLLQVLEQNPHFNFRMPGNIVRTIEQYLLKNRFSNDEYIGYLVESIDRIPTIYNIWLLNRIMNTVEDEQQRTMVLTLFRKIEAATNDPDIKDIAGDFLSDYED